MPLPIAGEVLVTVVDANPIQIHGDLYVDLALQTEPGETPTMARVPGHILLIDGGQPEVPAAGTRLVVRVLLGQVDGVRRPDDEPA